MEAVEADRKGKHAKVAMFKEWQGNSVPLTEETRKGDSWKTLRHLSKGLSRKNLPFLYSSVGFGRIEWIYLDSFDYEGSDTEDYSDMTFTESMFRICVYVTDNFYRDELYILRNEIFAFCRDRNIDIFWYIEQKMKYNELRPYKHGDKSY